MWKKELLYFVFLIQFPALSLAQGLLPAPVIYLVTVNPETGYDEIIWKSIPLSPDDYYDVAVRMNPEFSQPDSYMPVGNNIHDTVFVNTSTQSAFHAEGYTVWGVHPNGINNDMGLFHGPDSTIFLREELNSQDSTISLNWNDYNKWRGLIANYNIYRRLGPSNYQLIASIPDGTNFHKITDIEVDQQYDLFVEAVHEDEVRRSASNMVTISTHITQLPDYLNRTNCMVEIYPVPAGRILYVKSNKSPDKMVRIDILNANGEVIIAGIPDTSDNNSIYPLDISKLPKGFYLCKLFFLSGTQRSIPFIK